MINLSNCSHFIVKCKSENEYLKVVDLLLKKYNWNDSKISKSSIKWQDFEELFGENFILYIFKWDDNDISFASKYKKTCTWYQEVNADEYFMFYNANNLGLL